MALSEVLRRVEIAPTRNANLKLGLLLQRGYASYLAHGPQPMTPQRTLANMQIVLVHNFHPTIECNQTV